MTSRRGAHAFWHTTGTNLQCQTRNLKAVADQLGHASVSTSEIYTDMDDESTLVINDW